MSATVYAVIVTHNAGQWIAAAIESLRASSLPLEIVVVDNASSDGTVGIVKANHGHAEVITRPGNHGFGAANNDGIRYALARGADFIFLLNQDAKVSPGAVGHLVETLDRHPGFGIMSPLHLDYEGREVDPKFQPYLAAHSDVFSDALLGALPPVYEVPFVNAAAWLMRRSMLETVGGFDPIFFMYGEDNDYCLRARHYGFKVGIAPQSRISHWHGGAEDLPVSLKHMAHRQHIQAIHMLKRPDRSFARNVPGFLITWLRTCLHACIEGQGRQLLAAFLSLLKTARTLPLIHKHQRICRKQGPSWL